MILLQLTIFGKKLYHRFLIGSQIDLSSILQLHYSPAYIHLFKVNNGNTRKEVKYVRS